jgi:hypothetical protein
MPPTRGSTAAGEIGKSCGPQIAYSRRRSSPRTPFRVNFRMPNQLDPDMAAAIMSNTRSDPNPHQ